MTNIDGAGRVSRITTPPAGTNPPGVSRTAWFMTAR
jgi:hypothetical protein